MRRRLSDLNIGPKEAEEEKHIVFKSHDIRRMTPDQVVGVVENSIMSSFGISRALKWIPDAGSAIVAGPPRCGNGTMLLLVHLLSLHKLELQTQEMEKLKPKEEENNIPTETAATQEQQATMNILQKKKSIRRESGVVGDDNDNGVKRRVSIEHSREMAGVGVDTRRVSMRNSVDRSQNHTPQSENHQDGNKGDHGSPSKSENHQSRDLKPRKLADIPSNMTSFEDDVPFVESKLLDLPHKKKQLHGPQEGRAFPIYKTHMSGLVADQKILLQKGAKWISLFRDPIDLRLSFFRYIEEIYEQDRTDDQPKFEEVFTVEDFVPVPITTVRYGTANDQNVEQSFGHWYTMRERENLLLVCYEELVHKPGNVLKKLAKFLDVELSDEAFNQIMSHVDVDRLVKSYHKFHCFNEADHAIGHGRTQLGIKSVLQLEDMWFRFCCEEDSSLKNYEVLYELIVGEKHPFPKVNDALAKEGDEYMHPKQATILEEIGGVVDTVKSVATDGVTTVASTVVSVAVDGGAIAANTISHAVSKVAVKKKTQSCCVIN